MVVSAQCQMSSGATYLRTLTSKNTLLLYVSDGMEGDNWLRAVSRENESWVTAMSSQHEEISEGKLICSYCIRRVFIRFQIRLEATIHNGRWSNIVDDTLVHVGTGNGFYVLLQCPEKLDTDLADSQPSVRTKPQPSHAQPSHAQPSHTRSNTTLKTGGLATRYKKEKTSDYFEKGLLDLNFFFQHDFAATSTSKTTPSINIPQPFHNPLISVPHRLPLFLMRSIFFQAPIKCVACVGNDDELRIDPASNESVV